MLKVRISCWGGLDGWRRSVLCLCIRKEHTNQGCYKLDTSAPVVLKMLTKKFSPYAAAMVSQHNTSPTTATQCTSAGRPAYTCWLNTRVASASAYNTLKLHGSTAELRHRA